jgi:putative SOS response-associated peptidase YedK
MVACAIIAAMCNLYSMTHPRAGMARAFRAALDSTSNQPPLPAIFPDQMAPIVRVNDAGERVIEAMRWGFPSPPAVKGRPVTNVRNTASSYWRAWLKPGFRCLVPATSFCEYQDGSKLPTWFALGPDRPLFAFAGIWRPWTGLRAREDGEHRLYAFLTTEPNDVVRPVHAKAMPVVLAAADWDTWLEAPIEVALALQTAPAPDGLALVAWGERKDG